MPGVLIKAVQLNIIVSNLSNEVDTNTVAGAN